MSVRSHRGFVAAAVGLVLFLALAATNAKAATVVNGGFETGTLAGWTVQTEPSLAPNGWYAYSGTHSPLNGYTVAAPPQGLFAAITDQDNPSSDILYQDVRLPAGTRDELSFYVYYDSHAPISQQATLNYAVSASNQQYRVDVMKPTADPMSVSPSDILLNVFQTQTGAPEVLAPTVVTADLTPFAGQTVRLRFAQADNSAPLNASVDDVIVTTSPAASTLPASDVTAYAAKLGGTVNPEGAATTYHFEYGISTAYGTSTASTSAGSGSSAQTFSASLSKLKPDTTYHYRIVATSADGTVDGADVTFKTASKPSIHAAPANVVAGKSVRVYGNAGVCTAGSKLTLTSKAFSGSVHARAGKNLTYSVSTTIPSSRAAGSYTVSGRCGARTLGAHAKLHVTAVTTPVSQFTG